MNRKDIVDSISNGGLYDFVHRNGDLISKADLVDIIKELDFAITEYAVNVEIVHEALIGNLKETWGFNENE